MQNGKIVGIRICEFQRLEGTVDVRFVVVTFHFEGLLLGCMKSTGLQFMVYNGLSYGFIISLKMDIN